MRVPSRAPAMPSRGARVRSREYQPLSDVGGPCGLDVQPEYIDDPRRHLRRPDQLVVAFKRRLLRLLRHVERAYVEIVAMEPNNPMPPCRRLMIPDPVNGSLRER